MVDMPREFEIRQSYLPTIPVVYLLHGMGLEHAVAYYSSKLLLMTHRCWEKAMTHLEASTQHIQDDTPVASSGQG